MRDRSMRRLAWSIFVAALVGLAVGTWMDLVSGGGDPVFSIVMFVFPVVGLLIVHRRPRTSLGWLMLSMGIAFALPLESYARYALLGTEDRLPGGELALALASATWVPFIGISGFLLLLFPDGHLPSSRWRWFGWMCGIGLVLLVAVITFAPGTFEDIGFPEVENPLGIDALAPLGEWLFLPVAFAPLTVVGGAVAVIRRLRRTTDPTQRQQLRWLAWAAAVIAGSYVLAFVPALISSQEQDTAWENWLGTVAVMTFLLIPVTIGIAVLRYRLYDIDIVIRKTVVFAILAAFIAVVYVGVVVGVGALVGSRGSPVLSALAAAVVAIVFQPVRTRARHLADRLVYGKRATPYELLATFGEQLAGTYSADDVLPRIARVLGEGVGAERARVWLRVGDDLRVVAAWPEGVTGDGPDDFATEVRHRGEELGALSVAVPTNDPIDPTKEGLVRDLARQAGLVLSNVRLTEELRARLDDLRAAQKRLVTAQDHERKRLERNIHDGAQQQLVAMAVKLRLAEQLLDRDPERARGSLDQIQHDLQEALEDLRDLARGIYPPLLADRGLEAALTAQAARSPVPVEVDVAIADRYPQEVEAAVYFSCLECLQNVAKYAGATRATIEVTGDAASIAFAVTDDGRGFDPAANGTGSGLRGIADRLGALDGSIHVRSAPGAGTTITGRIPVQEQVASTT